MLFYIAKMHHNFYSVLYYILIVMLYSQSSLICYDSIIGFITIFMKIIISYHNASVNKIY